MFPFSTDAERLRAVRVILNHVAETLDAKFSVRLWDGSIVPLGRAPHPGLFVSLSSPGVIGTMLRWPTLDNLVRLYATGHIDFHGGDLMRFVDLARVPESRKRFKQVSKLLLARHALPFLFAPSPDVRLKHGFEGDCLAREAGPRANKDFIQFHYDLGNDFYELFLDPDMVYTCAYFDTPDCTLQEAQRAKVDLVCRKLRLKPGERMLDVGCGWGTLLIHAARESGVRARGVTLSQAQLDYALAKVRRLGLEDRVTMELRAFEKTEGTYDKISCVGMIEAIGMANYPAFFGRMYSLLRDRGILLNHGITCRAKSNPRSRRRLRPEQKFIAKYIFPGGELVPIGTTLDTMEASKLEVHDVENLRPHYVQTLRHWAQRLHARRDEAIRIVGLERYRLWLAYLGGMSYVFADGNAHLFQVVASKQACKGLSELPMTRDDLYVRSGSRTEAA